MDSASGYKGLESLRTKTDSKDEQDTIFAAPQRESGSDRISHGLHHQLLAFETPYTNLTTDIQKIINARESTFKILLFEASILWTGYLRTLSGCLCATNTRVLRQIVSTKVEIQKNIQDLLARFVADSRSCGR